jgi:hypothetical protein
MVGATQTIVRRSLAGPLPWLLALFALLNIGIYRSKTEFEAQRRANLLTREASAEGRAKPRFDQSVGENLGAYWSLIPDARAQPLVVVSGMSQMYAINDARPGDRTISEVLDDELSPQGIRVFGLAAPNMNNEEALLYLAATASSPETHPDVFVYGLCFDKMRNVDVRPKLLEFLRQRPELQHAFREVCDAREASFPMACGKIRATLATVLADPAKADNATPATDTLESSTRKWAAFVPAVGARKELNASIQLFAYQARNALLGIKSSSKRPMLRSRYELNQQLLALMVEVASSASVQLVLYVIPLNPSAENPYVAEEYDAFKRWSGSLADQHAIPFDNFEGLVPADQWGLNNGEPDYKHFREPGHVRTAEEILRRFGPTLRTRSQNRASQNGQAP